MTGEMDRSYAAGRRECEHLAFRYRVRARLVSRAVERHLGRTHGLAVLDFGSADGLTLLELHRLLPSSSFWGVEISDELLACVPKLPDAVRIVKGDVTDLPKTVKARAYDVVCALALLEHVPDPQAAVFEASAVLRPGGIFVATAPQPFWDHVSTKLGLLDGTAHLCSMSKKRMIGVVEDAGLRLLSYQPFMWAPVGVLPYLRIRVPPGLSLWLDRGVQALRLLNWGFVNQCVVARKPIP